MRMRKYVNKETRNLLDYCVHKYIRDDVPEDEYYEGKIDKMIGKYFTSDERYKTHPRECTIAGFIDYTIGNLPKKTAAEYMAIMEMVKEEYLQN